MARSLSPNDAGNVATFPSHNIKQHHATVRDAAAEIIRLKAARGEINAQITEQRSKIKAIGITAQDFNVALRLYELEDREKQAEAKDNLALCFEALGLATQGELFGAEGLPEQSKPDQPPAAKRSRSRSPKGKAKTTTQATGKNSGGRRSSKAKAKEDLPEAPEAPPAAAETDGEPEAPPTAGDDAEMADIIA